jgi:hypothetical protein
MQCDVAWFIPADVISLRALMRYTLRSELTYPDTPKLPASGPAALLISLRCQATCFTCFTNAVAANRWIECMVLDSTSTKFGNALKFFRRLRLTSEKALYGLPVKQKSLGAIKVTLPNSSRDRVFLVVDNCLYQICLKGVLLL